MLAGDRNFSPGPTINIDKNNMLDELPFRNCNLSIDWTDNQTNLDSDVSNSCNKWRMFKNTGMHFIHLDVIVCLLPKIEEIRLLAELTNASLIGISEMKLDEFVLNSEIVN